MKEVVKKILPSAILQAYRHIKFNALDCYAIKTYSQEGEDMILSRIFEKQRTGFYIDIGAYHPKKYSNTYFFYKRGWRGINIEPNPAVIKLFKKYRAGDINLEIGVSDQEGELTYFMFDEPALNSFSRELSEERVSNTNYRIIGRKKVKVSRLDTLLAEYLPNNTSIDFMSVDAEGYDLNILKSNNWKLYRPKCLLVESLKSSLSDIFDCPLHHYITDRNYELFAKTFNSLFYIDKLKENKSYN
ncbi:MAG: FkbM family methyltransferase [wastewater metagenome]|nr:FkbM family methyltransferase [Candidatus Loosdrechtia aerotolerans]